MTAPVLHISMLILSWTLIVSGVFLIHSPSALIVGGLLILFDLYR